LHKGHDVGSIIEHSIAVRKGYWYICTGAENGPLNDPALAKGLLLLVSGSTLEIVSLQRVKMNIGILIR
ncbi:MAG: hypothetical protein ABI456_03170, partial [Ktedonobacteraceae bacterium]